MMNRMGKHALVLAVMVLVMVVLPMAVMAETASVSTVGELREALANANYDVIQLIADINIELSDGTTPAFCVNRSVTIDGGTQKYTIKDNRTGSSGATFVMFGINDNRGTNILAPKENNSDMLNIEFKNMILDSNTGVSSGRVIDTRGKPNGSSTNHEGPQINLTIDNCELITRGKVGANNTHNQTLNIGGNANSTVSKVTIKNSSIDANASEQGYAIAIWNPVEMEITNSELKGYAAIYCREGYFGNYNTSAYGSDNSKINIKNSELITPNSFNHEAMTFGTIVLEKVKGVEITLVDNKIDNEKTGTSLQPAVLFNGNTEENKIKISGDNIIIDKIQVNVEHGTNDSIEIASGVFTNDDPSPYVSQNTPVAQVSVNGESKYAVGAASIAQSVAEAAAQNAEDTELTVTQGELKMDNVPAGVTVSVTTGAKAIVNGIVVTDPDAPVVIPDVSGVSSLPSTGDNSHLLLFAALLALSGAGLMVYRKTREN